jgi:hypothetical protein
MHMAGFANQISDPKEIGAIRSPGSSTTQQT